MLADSDSGRGKLMSVHSKDGNQKTTKLERISKLAIRERDVVFNNIGHVLDTELLREAYTQLDGKKAVGTDGVTKESYGQKLEDNLQDLLVKIRKGTYKPRPSRLVEIPKEDGSSRPLALSCFEDKVVQQAVSSILNKIFEPLFLPCSYGYREGRNGHEALRELMKYSYQISNGAIVEIDLQKYFNTIPHEELMKILRNKISDVGFLRLVEKLIRSPIMEGRESKPNKRGCPQGSIISPILSNIYLHYVLDDWFHEIRKTHIKGRAELVRFADDMVFVFEHREEAERFYKTLPKRLEKFGLTLHEVKSSVIPSGKKAAEAAQAKGERLPTYKFLGFVCYWGVSRTGFWRLKYKSRSDRVTAKLKGLRKYCKESYNKDTYTVLKRAAKIVRGWINYHAISDNQRRVGSFILMSKRTLLSWLNRKGGRYKTSWEEFNRMLKRVGYPESFKTTSMFATC